MYLFDTDVLSNLMKRSPSHDLLKVIGSVLVGSQFTFSITLGELVYGARRRGSGSLMEKIEERVAPKLPILPFDVDAARRYDEVRADLERQGTPIGDADARITVIALVRRLIEMSGNTRCFRKIPHLIVEGQVATCGYPIRTLNDLPGPKFATRYC